MEGAAEETVETHCTRAAIELGLKKVLIDTHQQNQKSLLCSVTRTRSFWLNLSRHHLRRHHADGKRADGCGVRRKVLRVGNALRSNVHNDLHHAQPAARTSAAAR